MTVDFTQIVSTIVSFALTTILAVFLAWVRSHVKDQAAAAVIANAVTNGVGAAQNAIDAELKAHPLQTVIPGASASTAAGVQYILDNAGPQLARFPDITPATLASKIEAKMGLANVPATVAEVTTAAAAAPAVTPPVQATVAPGARLPWSAKP